MSLGPALVAALLSTFWLDTRRLTIGGDEPHYLILAASLVRDGDLRLENNYRHDRATREIFGRMEPHVYRRDGGWMPYHTPGLGVLLALPFEVYGQRGARYVLCALVSGLGLLAYCWFGTEVSRSAARWLSVGTVASLPAVFGASQIFPDLAGGVVVAGLALWLWRGSGERRWPEWVGFWTVAGLTPWLHIKFAAPVAVLALAGLAQAGRRARQPGASGWAVGGAFLPFLLGPVSLGWFHVTAFGSLLGGRSTVELSTDFYRGLELFLGLHLDQAQGMFFQHPLLVGGGLFGLGVLVRMRHPVVVPWLAVYATIIIPNAMQLARYGGGGPAGRFGWSVVWLWLVPIGVWLARDCDRWQRYVGVAVTASVLYQTALALRWIPTPSVLFPILEEALSERNSLFPVSLRWAFPSFYFWDYRSYLTYGPNLIWLAAAGGWLLCGVFAGAPSPPVVHPTPPQDRNGDPDS